MPKATLKRKKVVKKAKGQKPGAESRRLRIEVMDEEIKLQKDHVNSLKGQYLAEYDKLNAMRAKRDELKAKDA